MKKKDSKNYLDFVPEKNPEIEYEADEANSEADNQLDRAVEVLRGKL